MDKLTDDLLIEIFSRVPYKCLRRFACVSRRWRALIAHPDNRRKLPQTLAGFFYYTTSPRFADVSGTDPPFFDLSLAFLPDREREGLDLVDGCNGLLLFRCYRFADAIEFDYLSSTLPQRSGLQCRSHGVGRTSDSEDNDDDGDGHVLGVTIYSSVTRVWSHKQSNWCVDVFVCGMLYVITICSSIGAVDVEGRTWRIIDFPCTEESWRGHAVCGSPFFDTGAGLIDLSQGKLHLANNYDVTGDQLAIWALEDNNSKEWTLKHTVSFRHLLKHVQFGFHEFIVVAMHPDRNMSHWLMVNNNPTVTGWPNFSRSSSCSAIMYLA
ncbi:hypothetical protein PR202_ga12366 [Eleusine coracana subsp. coracana]|uniref:F-box domain-containing protein n=1 Tax=Eleusine coracana subsp. coracana TaxID=191504 RepID=A0AAV5CBX4_ELECO|nr:hypothetical protein PR202_ga12366 [Eleusine coracana subsp. coracana]